MTISVTQLHKGHCVECLTELVNVHAAEGELENQYEDVLDLVFFPGYGEKIDGDKTLRFHLCNECADKLFGLFPNLYAQLLLYSTD
jgi:hypothetical protein